MDSVRLKAVREIAAPKKKTELQSVLRHVNYNRLLMPSLSRVEAALRECANALKFDWTRACEAALISWKELIERKS